MLAVICLYTFLIGAECFWLCYQQLSKIVLRELGNHPKVYIWNGEGTQWSLTQIFWYLSYGRLVETYFVWYCLEPNPHMGHLAWADAFVITADSVSMLSEACTTGYVQIMLFTLFAIIGLKYFLTEVCLQFPFFLLEIFQEASLRNWSWALQMEVCGLPQISAGTRSGSAIHWQRECKWLFCSMPSQNWSIYYFFSNGDIWQCRGLD